jgi:hypothetical protein
MSQVDCALKMEVKVGKFRLHLKFKCRDGCLYLDVRS